MSGRRTKIAGLIVAAAVGAALLGCGNSAAQHEAAGQGGTPVGAASEAGKPVAALGLTYDVAATAQVGETVVLRLALRPAVPIENATVRVTVDDGLHVDPAAAEFSAPSVTADSPAEWSVDVTPAREGRHLIRIHAEGRIDGTQEARSVVVPIRVGAEPDKDASQAAPASPRSTRKASEAEPAAAEDRHETQTETQIRLPAQERR